jgi:hypothetical protein
MKTVSNFLGVERRFVAKILSMGVLRWFRGRWLYLEFDLRAFEALIHSLAFDSFEFWMISD